jgi:hypothetical protein
MRAEILLRPANAVAGLFSARVVNRLIKGGSPCSCCPLGNEESAMRLHLLPCLFAALALLAPTATADGTEIAIQVPTEIYNSLPTLPEPKLPIDIPNFVQCVGPIITQVCIVFQPEPCVGLDSQATIKFHRDSQGVGVWVQVGAGGPGGHGGYSDWC